MVNRLQYNKQSNLESRECQGNGVASPVIRFKLREESRECQGNGVVLPVIRFKLREDEMSVDSCCKESDE